MKEKKRSAYSLFILASLVSFIVGFATGLIAWLAPVGLLWSAFYAYFLPVAYLRMLRGDNAPFKEVLMEELESSGWRYSLASLLSMLFVFGWSLLLFIPGIIKQFSYAMTPYILKDNPEMKALDAITKSREMMRGNKGAYFTLVLSYYSWVLIPFVVWIVSSLMLFATLFTFGSLGSPVLIGVVSIVAGIGTFAASAFVLPRWQLAQGLFYEQLSR